MILLILFAFPLAYSSKLDCFVDNQECEITADTLLETYTGILTAEECGTLCDDGNLCTAFTFFGPTSFPISSTCLLFSSCVEHSECSDCSMGSSQSECLCSINFSGTVNDDNLVEIVTDIGTEHKCKKTCADHELCFLYTFYNSLDLSNPSLCILLSSGDIQIPALPCDTCATGPATCNTGERCQAAVVTNGEDTQAIFADKNMAVNMVAAEKDCFIGLSVLAIGGGGRGYNGAGGGSGYVETTTIQLTLGNSTANVRVGTDGEHSSVEVGNTEALRAEAGEHAGYTSGDTGGDGYSGGGSFSSYTRSISATTTSSTTTTAEPTTTTPSSTYGPTSGGADGGSGNGDHGGSGSGLDLGTIKMASFVLTPGKGGESSDSGNGYSGGGGGVVVNGNNPASSSYNGQGYGGGGGNDGYGLSGLVLIELAPTSPTPTKPSPTSAPSTASPLAATTKSFLAFFATIFLANKLSSF